MIGTIHKIHDRKISRNGNTFIRVEFIMKDGSWTKTDVCPDFRNYATWEPIIKKGSGQVVKGLIFKRKPSEIDADSQAQVIGYEKKLEQQKLC